MNREQMINLLESKGVTVRGTTEDFDGSKRGIWIAAEGKQEHLNYYSAKWSNTFGVEPRLDKAVNKKGWFFEWYDPGTMMVYPM